MVIIGEKLNSSVKAAHEVFAERNETELLAIGQAQLDQGVDYLDVNTAMMEDEKEDLLWAAKLLTTQLGAWLSVDSPSPDVVAHVYENVKLAPSIINSVSLEKERFDGMMELVTKYDTGVIALPIGDNGMPQTAEDRVEGADEIIRKITERGVELSRIYVDVIAESAAANYEAPMRSIEAARILRRKYPDVHLIVGLSNVSHGLPRRQILNSAFLCCLMMSGLDSAIMNPMRIDTMLTMHACDVVLGDDEYCMEYITACRAADEAERNK